MTDRLQQLCIDFHKTKTERDLARVSEKTLTSKLVELGDEIKEIFIEMGLQSQNYKGMGTFHLIKKVRASCSNSDIFFKYLRDNGEGDMIKSAVPPKTLSAWSKKQLDDENTIENLEQLGVRVFEQFTIGVKKS